MRHEGEGLTLWCGDADTPAPSGDIPVGAPVSVTVGVRPAHVTNRVDVEYRIDKGPKRVAPGVLLRDRGPAHAQLFRAVFPYVPAGSTVEYAPILRSLGRRIGGPLDAGDAPSFSVRPTGPSRGRVERQVPAPTGQTRHLPMPEPFPHTLERLARVQASLAPGVIIGATPDGLRVNFLITGGRIVGPRFNATVEGGGGDALRVRTDGTAVLGVRTTLLADDGTRIFTEYSGVLELGADGYQRALKGDYLPTPQVTLAPRFECASKTYEWLNRLQCIGIGSVDMAALEVNYDLYVLRMMDVVPA